jgi:hypothetical protein
VRLRAIASDLLAEIALAQHSDRRAGAKHGDDQGERTGKQDGGSDLSETAGHGVNVSEPHTLES